MGIDIPSGIIKNASCKRQNLTIRTFLHIFLIEEDNIIQKDSILFQKGGYSKTAILSTLLYLITGNSFEDNEEFDEKPIKEAKKTAVIEYINNSLSDLASLKNELPDYGYYNLGFIEENINSILNQIDSAESNLSQAVKRSETLSSEIYELNNQIAECNMLHNRYQVLQGQYVSDINRLTFLVEGEVHRPEYIQETLCPFCNGELEKGYQESCIEAASVELKKIMLQLNDLNDAEEDISIEKNNLEEMNNVLQMERAQLEEIINSKLKPKIKHLRHLLHLYRKSMEVQSQIRTIRHLEHNMIDDLNAFEMKNEVEVKYKPKEYFDFLILQGISTILESILEACNFDNLSSAYFSKDTFDVVVNGKEKSKFGQGYRAFLNTVVALTFMEYLKQCGTYSPGILIVDSPILSLKEKKSEQASENMKESLFRYMLKHQDNGQMIIVENEIPELDYSNANLIYFSKDIDDGRYGLLYGLTE